MHCFVLIQVRSGGWDRRGSNVRLRRHGAHGTKALHSAVAPSSRLGHAHRRAALPTPVARQKQPPGGTKTYAF